MEQVSNQTKKTGKVRSGVQTEKLVWIGLMAALAYILMLLHLPFKYLGFLEIEFSDVPAILTGILYGPVAGIVVELIKNAIKAITASTTVGVGELANFIICCGYVVPASLLFRKLKGAKGAVLTGVLSTICFAAVGFVVNYFITVPLYAKMFHGMDAVIGACAQTIPSIDSMAKVVLLGITPFNLIKGTVLTLVSYLVYGLYRKAFPKNIVSN